MQRTTETGTRTGGIVTARQVDSAAVKARATGRDVWLSDPAPRGAGRLAVRCRPNGARLLMYRYTTGDGRRDAIALGAYDSAGVKGLDLAEARRKAGELVRLVHGGVSDVRAHRAEQQRAASLARAAEQAAREQAADQSLQRLVLAYCDHLQALGRTAHRDARSIFTLHLVGAFPRVAAQPAAEVTDEQIADMLRALFTAGKARTANKLRAYLRAAYEVARKARTDPKIPEPFKAYGVKHNPAADTAANTSENRADKNPLDADDLRAYWRIIERMPGRKGAVLRLHLLTGAQRIEQLVKLKACDVTAASITLFDGKGRPGKPPRPHPLPLIPAAATALQAALADDSIANGTGIGGRDARPAPVFALSSDGGQTHIAATSLSAWACEAAGEHIGGFKAKRLRSGVETALAAAGISKEVRGRLQSHGITGVQDAHYNAHDYMPEKLQALQVLHKLLTKAPRAKGAAE